MSGKQQTTDRLQKIVQKRVRKSRRKLIRYGLLFGNMALFGFVIWFVSQNPSKTTTGINLSIDSQDQVQTNPLDQVSTADIAVEIAQLTRMDEVVAVKNHADSFNAQLATTAIDDVVVAKPQVVSTALKSSKDIITYTAVAGDTITSVAAKFNITADSVRHSNSLVAEEIETGKVLLIPPVSGLVYTTKAGDTVDSLSERYGVSKAEIIADNDLEITGLKVNQRLLLRGGQRPVVAVSVYSGYGGSSFYAQYYGDGNGYDYGWCTWHAANRRRQIGHPIPSNLGNANTWASLAAQAGMNVSSTPTEGAVAYYKFIGGLGHVGFVEKDNGDGTFWISDMNYYGVSQINGTVPAGGWGRVSYHKVGPNELGGYLFIQ